MKTVAVQLWACHQEDGYIQCPYYFQNEQQAINFRALCNHPVASGNGGQREINTVTDWPMPEWCPLVEVKP